MTGSGRRSGASAIAATSRATPTTLRQSDRFGVKPISYMTSLRPNCSNTGRPKSRSEGKIMMPSDCSDRPSSLIEQSMPKDSWPRIFDFLILKFPGRTVPTCARAIRSPVLWFWAPQTTCCVALPVLTVQTVSRSASGCCCTSARRATMTVSSPSPKRSIASTSRPVMVNRWERSSALKSKSTYSLSQFKVTFIPKVLY